MAHGSKLAFLGLLLLAGSAFAATVGPVKGKAVTGRPLELNIPFSVDEPTDRACASANVRYGSAPVSRVVVDVQGRGLKRNLLVTAPAHVSEAAVTLQVRVGCGARAVARKFVLSASQPPARTPVLAEPARKRAVTEVTVRSAPKTVVSPAPSEPLFPPPVTEARPQESSAPRPDAAMEEELRKARSDAAAAVAQLEATRKELAAVLDVVRRTSQTLIQADHQVRDAQSEAAHMRLVLMWVGAGLALVAAGIVWWEFHRLSFWKRTARPRPVEEPGFPSGVEMAT